jgi:membrane associated rhomboid family serine protease
MGEATFPVTAPEETYGYYSWGQQRVCSRQHLEKLVSKKPMMVERLVWTPASKYMKSTLEIPWLQSAVLLRSSRSDRRWIVFYCLALVVQSYFSLKSVGTDPSVKGLASEVGVLASLVCLLYLSARDYLDAVRFSEAGIQARAFRARFLAWVLHEPVPWLWGLGASLAIIFSLQRLADIGSTDLFPPSARALGFSKPLTFAGEWWRMLTGPLLHHHFPHLAGNLVVLFIMCRFLEPLAARWTVPLVAVTSALAGSATSLVILPTSLSVGFSGALSGIIAFLLLLLIRRRQQLPGRFLPLFALGLLAAAISDWSNSSKVDYAGHAGGFVAGLLLAFCLVPNDTQEIPLRSFTWATRIGQLCAVVLIIDALLVAERLFRLIEWGNLL